MGSQRESLSDEVETREDEEQGKKLEETIQLLLAAGYFRARIKGLSAFDKVVGGMTWCITTCDYDVDVDLLFQENSTIGQKIALTEKIVAVLPKMKCPHRIEPHQIQGLDFIHIFPVVQWLVKRAIETRQELGDQIRAFSVVQFNKYHKTPQDELFEDRKEKCFDAAKVHMDVYKPKRYYRKPRTSSMADAETIVHTTLLEYGRRYGASKQAKSEKEHKMADLKRTSTGTDKGDVDDYAVEESRIKALMAGMSTAELKESLSTRVVGSIVGIQSDEISQMAQEYARRQEELIQEASEMKAGKTSGILGHQRQVAALQKSIEGEKVKLEEALDKQESIHNELEQAKEQRTEAFTYKERLVTETEKLNSLMSDADKSILEKLRSLVALNESLKQQEQAFRAQCKEELARLQAEMEKLKTTTAEDDSEEAERSRQIAAQLEKDEQKFQKIRLLLAKKNRDIASLQWKIDDVPWRAELAQYQRRFVELYNQVAATHKETKQFYTLYNTLDDTKLYLEKEVNILTSISDNFSQALNSPSAKDEFLKQMENIAKGVIDNKHKVDKKKQSEKSKRDNLNDVYLELVEKQRLYVKLVKDFKEECRKNEKISSKLASLGR